MTTTRRFSPRLEARVTGLIYLCSIAMGIAAMILIGRRMQAQGNQANFVAGVLYTGMTILLWDLLRPVSQWMSTLAALVSLAGCWMPASWYKSAHLGNFHLFGAYCVLVGYLILRSRFFPKVIGILMACAGVCWLAIAGPGLPAAISPYLMVVGLIGEGALMLYLLVKGVDERRWREQAHQPQ